MMSVDGSWDVLKLCKPTLSPNIQYESRRVRDERWLILRNTVTGEHIRLNASAAAIFSLIDGDTSLEALCALGVNHGFDPEDVSAFIGPMCAIGLLSIGTDHEQERLIAQQESNQKSSLLNRFKNPLAIRIPLHNPDKWLALLIQKLPWLFRRWVLVTALSIIAVAILAAIVNVSMVVEEFKRVAASPQHWWLYILMYPALKALHELAHALVIKRWGGSVHETGITFLVLMPIPYVDASDAWMFPSKYQRILVGAAGMVAECALASIGLFVFLTVQPGFAQELGFAVFFMGSVTTILFNANPLLKFDGYYILQDWLDIPNLSTRAQNYCRYLFKKYIYRISSARSPVSAGGEGKWLLIYGVMSSVYRAVITVVIALFLASKFLVLGVALALFALFQLLVTPLLRLIVYLRNSPELVDVRARSIGVTAALVLTVLLAVSFLPVPSTTRTEGVVWVPNQAQVFAAQAGVVEELVVEPGTHVVTGQVLIRLSAPELSTAKSVVEAQLATARVSYRTLQQTDTAGAQGLASDIQSLQLELSNLVERSKHLEITASNNGQFVIDEQSVVAGRLVKQGELLAYVVDKQDLVVKAVLTQQRIERFQAGVEQAQVRLADSFGVELDARLTRQTPAGVNTLPSPALAYDGSGGIAVASQTDEQLKTLERVFHIELALPNEAVIAGIGGRAYVTLHHEPESLGKRWWRSTRQLLLKQLTV